MNKTKVCLGALTLILMVTGIGCKKGNNNIPPSINKDSTNFYYFRFTVNNSTDTIAGHNIIIIPNVNYLNEMGGAVTSNDSTKVPLIGLYLEIKGIDTPTESQFLSIAGRTIPFFTDPNVDCNMIYLPSDGSNWNCGGITIDSSCYFRLDSMSFLSAENYKGYPLKHYLVKGSYKIPFINYSQPTDNIPLTGTFRMIMSRIAYR